MIYDTVIIGAGPAGLSAAIYAQRANINCILIDKIYIGGGQIATANDVDNYLGIPNINGWDLGEKFLEHAKSLNATIIQGEIQSIQKNQNIYQLSINNKEPVETKTIIYAAGATHKKLDVPGEDTFLGKGVSYCATCDGAFYKDKTVAVIGGGDTALSDAHLLSKICKKVYLIHRRDTFRANSTIVNAVKNTANIELVLGYTTVSIEGIDTVNAITLRNIETQIIKTLDIDGVFIAVGIVPQSELLRDLVQTDKGGFICADETGETSSAGIFVAGDVRTKKFRQVITAVSDGANCIASVEEYLHQDI